MNEQKFWQTTKNGRKILAYKMYMKEKKIMQKGTWKQILDRVANE